jgi:hypothetical protein
MATTYNVRDKAGLKNGGFTFPLRNPADQSRFIRNSENVSNAGSGGIQNAITATCDGMLALQIC